MIKCYLVLRENVFFSVFRSLKDFFVVLWFKFEKVAEASRIFCLNGVCFVPFTIFKMHTSSNNTGLH